MASKNKDNVIRKYFEFFTKDFEPDPNPIIIWVDNGNGTKSYHENPIELTKELKVKMPYIVFIIFVKILKFNYQGRGEKVAWEIPVLYKGIPFILAHRKFGFTISTPERQDMDVHGLAIDAITDINKTVKYAEQIMAPEIKILVNEGRITLDSQYLDIRDRYLFFRRKANAEFKTTDKETEMSKFIREMREQPFTTKEGQYYLIAMLDAYFSLLEHILVLLVPFLKVDLPEGYTLEKFISSNWKDKYNALFHRVKDKQVAVYLNQLVKIKEQYRNPVSHGHFEKNGSSIYVHMSGLGAIPMSLAKSKTNLNYGFNTTLNVLTFKDICTTFDSFDRFLNELPETKYGIEYISSNFPVAFDPKTRREYANAMTSDAKFKKYLMSVSAELTDAMNMDW